MGGREGISIFHMLNSFQTIIGDWGLRSWTPDPDSHSTRTPAWCVVRIEAGGEDRGGITGDRLFQPALPQIERFVRLVLVHLSLSVVVLVVWRGSQI